MTRSRVLTVAGIFALGCLAGAMVADGFALGNFGKLAGSAPVSPAVAPAHPVWTEIEWPFPIDQWGKGKAFSCSPADCGVEVKLFLRAKIGFCNCATGVSDDDELDRISDYDLLGNGAEAAAPGRQIKIAWMNGRSRLFAFKQRKTASAISIGFNDRCDAMVATIVVDHDKPALLEPAAIAFLNSDRVLKWAEATLGL